MVRARALARHSPAGRKLRHLAPWPRCAAGFAFGRLCVWRQMEVSKRMGSEQAGRPRRQSGRGRPLASLGLCERRRFSPARRFLAKSWPNGKSERPRDHHHPRPNGWQRRRRRSSGWPASLARFSPKISSDARRSLVQMSALRTHAIALRPLLSLDALSRRSCLRAIDLLAGSPVCSGGGGGGGAQLGGAPWLWRALACLQTLLLDELRFVAERSGRRRRERESERASIGAWPLQCRRCFCSTFCGANKNIARGLGASARAR